MNNKSKLLKALIIKILLLSWAYQASANTGETNSADSTTVVVDTTESTSTDTANDTSNVSGETTTIEETSSTSDLFEE